MTNNLKCPFCGAELQTDNEMARLIMWRCHTPGCLLNGWHNAEIIQALIDGKKAQDALNKILAIKESVEGCCAEIQQNCLPLLFSIDRDMKLKIDKEVSEIDKYMSEVDEIASITTQET